MLVQAESNTKANRVRFPQIGEGIPGTSFALSQCDQAFCPRNHQLE